MRQASADIVPTRRITSSIEPTTLPAGRRRTSPTATQPPRVTRR
jgi:hypothetical protein